MKDRKHTPGPWHYEPKAIAPSHIISAGEKHICKEHTSGFATDAEQLANARLIAAAPELLDALDRVNMLIYARGAPLGSDNYFSIRKTLCNAIDKATGVDYE